jgi:hypothetical protein
MNIAAIPSGYVLAPQYQTPQLAKYDASGRLQALYDRKGAGPGELTPPISLLRVRGDTVFVVNFDRLLTFDGQLRPLATSRINVQANAAALLRDGRLVVSYRLRQSGNVSALVHILDRSGRIAKSVEFDSTATQSPDFARQVAGSSDGGFWVAPVNDNWLRKYTSNGILARQLRVRRAWMIPSRGVPFGLQPYLERPRPRLYSMRETGSRRLLTLGHVADAEWRAADREPVVNANENINSLYDSVIDVIDSNSGEVLATARHPQYLRIVENSDDLVAAAQETTEGDVKAVLYRIRTLCK